MRKLLCPLLALAILLTGATLPISASTTSGNETVEVKKDKKGKKGKKGKGRTKGKGKKGKGKAKKAAVMNIETAI